MKETNDSPPALERWVGVEEVAEHLGCGVGYVRKLAEAKKIPASNLGYGKKRYWRFRLSKVDAAINSPEFGISPLKEKK